MIRQRSRMGSLNQQLHPQFVQQFHPHIVPQTQVLNSGQESRKSIAPYLAIPALRRVISTFANDPSGQFASWSTNPKV
jgi:hypothetical protein